MNAWLAPVMTKNEIPKSRDPIININPNVT